MEKNVPNCGARHNLKRISLKSLIYIWYLYTLIYFTYYSEISSLSVIGPVYKFEKIELFSGLKYILESWKQYSNLESQSASSYI